MQTPSTPQPTFAERSSAASREIIEQLKLTVEGERFLAACDTGWALVTGVAGDWAHRGHSDMRAKLCNAVHSNTCEVQVSPSTFVFLAGEIGNATRSLPWSFQVRT